MTTAGITFFQVISFVTTMISLAMVIVSIRKDPSIHYASIPMAVLLLHQFIFYAILLLDKSGIDLIQSIRFTNWSSILRWHTSVTIFTIIMAKIFYSKTMKLR